MLTDSPGPDSLLQGSSKTTGGSKLIAALSALAVTGLVLGGYAYLRHRHASQALSVASSERVPSKTKPTPQAHILVDEARLKGGQSILGGTVRNISAESLNGVEVELELRRRRDGAVEHVTVPLDPSVLAPQQEGRYELKLLPQDYSSGRVFGLRRSTSGEALAYTTALGQKRAPERFEPKPVIVPKRSSNSGEFLNSPNNPVRVP